MQVIDECMQAYKLGFKSFNNGKAMPNSFAKHQQVRNHFFINWLRTRNLKTAKNHDDLIVMIRELEKRKWFTSDMLYQIERYVIRHLNEF